MRLSPHAVLLSAVLLAPVGAAQNLLTNADFEAGLTGWNVFGNAFPASDAPPQFVAQSGTELVTMFGNFSGGFDVSGIFQEFPASEGDTFTIDASSRHWSGDPLIGAGPGADNWVVMKMAFFDAGGVEIGGAEGTILDGTSPTDTWIDNAAVEGTAPAGTDKVQALILFLQPNNDGGAAQIEDVSFTAGSPPPPPPTGNLLSNADFENGLADWNVFGNAFPDVAAPPVVEPLSGTGIAKMFGNFSGGFDVTGIFQEFPAAPGDNFTLDAFSRHYSGDPLTGTGAPDFNWVVMKMAFFDAGGVEIGGAEGTILDGTSPTDVWIDNPAVHGTAPPGTDKVQALILFLQPNNDGGAAQFDDVVFTTDATPPPPPPPPAPTGNILANPSFEAGLSNWDTFGNVFTNPDSPPQFEALTGSTSASMFGLFDGGFNVSGMFQTFGARAGQVFTMDAATRHWSGDSMVGVGAPGNNWVVMKLAFFDAFGVEIGAVESTILDGNSPTDVWIDNAPISGAGPAGTKTVQALVLYLQPAFDGGAAQIDDVFLSTDGPCNIAVNGDFETGDFTGWDEFPSGPGHISIVSPGADGTGSAALLDNTTEGSATLIKNSFLGVGLIEADEEITISFDAKGSLGVGGVIFPELFTEGSGGVSKAEILGGGPLPLDPDPSVWTSYSFDTTLGPDVTNGVTLQLAAITGSVAGSTATVSIDNVRVEVERGGASWTLYGEGWPGTAGVPTLSLDTTPVLGEPATILLGNAAVATTPAAFIWGDTQTADLSPWGGTILTNQLGLESFLMLDAAGGTIPFVVPNNVALCDMDLYGQLIHLDGGASAGVAFSRGLRFIFGG